MNIEIIKFGGTCLATFKEMEYCLRIIKDKINKNNKVLVVVSAMGRMGFPYSTDNLLKLGSNALENEKDRIASCGEIISSVTFSSFLNMNEINAISLSYLESGIFINKSEEPYKIMKIDCKNIINKFTKYDVVIVPGFIAISSSNKEVVTLSRGDSDLTPILYAKTLNVKNVTLYKDVMGVYPFIQYPLKNYKSYRTLSYFDMKLLLRSKNSIISKSAFGEAFKNNIEIHIGFYKDGKVYTKIGDYASQEKVIGFYQEDKFFSILCLSPLSIKEEVQDLFYQKHIFIKDSEIIDNEFKFKIDHSIILLVKKTLINHFFSGFIVTNNQSE